MLEFYQSLLLDLVDVDTGPTASSIDDHKVLHVALLVLTRCLKTASLRNIRIK